MQNIKIIIIAALTLTLLTITQAIPSTALQPTDYYWRSPIAVHSACSTSSAANIIDRDYNTLWHHWTSEAHWVVLDLGDSYQVTGIRQRHERRTDGEAAIAAIYVSENTTDWGSSLGSLPNTHNMDPGWIEASITPAQGRYVRLVSEVAPTPYWREIQIQVYGDPDAVPPAAITDLSISSTGSHSMVLSWTATGDDGSTGTAFEYDLRYAQTEITAANWGDATPVDGEPFPPSPSGSSQTMSVNDLEFDTTYYFALIALDEMSNPSGLSNVISATTQYGTTTIDEMDVYLDFIAGQHVDGTKTMYFRLFRPDQFDNGTDYPLIVFLHWNSGQGDDNQKQIADTSHHYMPGIQPWIDNQTEHPAFVLAPQCPLNNVWVDSHWSYGSYDLDTVPESDDLGYVVRVINDLIDTYNIDENRIFVTGLSMGGMGTWDIMLRHPNLFVAGMPVCGCGSPGHAVNIQDVPIWAFHGALDTTISVEGSRDMVSALNNINGDIHYTEYPDKGHDISGLAYTDSEAIAWVYSYLDPTPAMNLSGSPGDQTINLTWSVNTTLPAAATWHIDYYTTTLTTPYTATDPLSTTRAYTLQNLTNYQFYTVTLSALLDSTAFLSDTVRVMPTDRLVYLPVVMRAY